MTPRDRIASTYQVVEGPARYLGTYSDEEHARRVAANVAAESGSLVRVLENRLGGAHGIRAVTVATYDKEGLLVDRARHDPTKVRSGTTEERP